MEKKKIVLDYESSGVKTTQIVAYIIGALTVISGIGVFILIFMSVNNPIYTPILIWFIAAFVVLMIAHGICMALSTIAKNALIQTAIAKESFEFEEKKQADKTENKHE